MEYPAGVVNGELYLHLSGELVCVDDFSIYATIVSEKDEYDLMQFTGLFDRNGKEIYEGDILRCQYEDVCEETGEGEYFGVVTFENGCFRGEEPGFDYIKNHETPMTIAEWTMDKTCTVVGNIHQNPELL